MDFYCKINTDGAAFDSEGLAPNQELPRILRHLADVLEQESKIISDKPEEYGPRPLMDVNGNICGNYLFHQTGNREFKENDDFLVFTSGVVETEGGISICRMDRNTPDTSPTERDSNAAKIVECWNIIKLLAGKA